MAEKRKKKTSLIVNLIIMIGLGIVALTALQVVVLSKIAKAESRNDHVENYIMLTNSIRDSLENTIQGYFMQLNPYVNSDIMKSGNFDLVGRWLQQNPQIKAKEFDYVMIADAKGYSYNDNGTRTDIKERDYFQAVALKGAERFVDNPVISKTTGNKVIHITRPVRNGKGDIFAMVAGVINVDVLIQPIKALKIPDGIWVFVIDHNGNVLYHPVATDDGNFISNPGEGHEDLSEISRRMVEGESGYAWINSYTGSKQDLLVYSGIAGTPWGMGFLVPGKMVDKLGLRIADTALLFGAIMVIIILVVSGIVLAFALKPLKIVENAITGISQGNADLTQRISIKSNNEIGQVVKGFNSFADKLQTIISDVKASKNELGVAGEDMSSTAQDTASAITQIIANIDSFRSQL